MTDFAVFICGLVVTLITGMGVISSQVFMGYDKFKNYSSETDTKVLEQI